MQRHLDVPPSDQVLWDASVAGDADAFAELFVRHNGAVYTYCFRRTASWATAEDLVSVVFLEVWRTRRALELQGGSLLPWLIGVATRVHLRHLRSETRQGRMLRLVGGHRAETPAPVQELATARVDAERRMARVLDALTTLPRRDQEVIAACVFAELDHADAALALGVPIGTVKSRLSRARARLSDTLSSPPNLSATRPARSPS